jgi:predicted ATP-grasp superfamily ATP-dependent carboligase
VVAADLFADADSCAIAAMTRVDEYPKGFADWLARQSVDGWLYTGGLENHPELVEQMASIAPLWGVVGPALRRLRDPCELGRLAAEFAVAWPETAPIVGTPRDGEWLAKTYRHAGGSGVVRPDSSVDWSSAATRGGVAQRFVSGTPLAAIFACSAATTILLGVTEQLLGDGPARWSYRGSIGPLPLDPRRQSELERVGRLLAAARAKGVVGVDLIDDGDRLWLLEVNPRWTASVEVLERAAAESLFPVHVAACRGELTPPTPSAQGMIGKWIVTAPAAVVASEALHDWAMAECDAGRAADIPHVGDSFDPGDPVLTLFAEADSAEEVRALLAYRSAEALRRVAHLDHPR